MLKPVSSLLVAMFVAIFVTTTSGAQPQPQFQHPTSDWLTWSLKDTAEEDNDLSGYQNSDTFVVLFSAADSKSCKMMSAIAAHIRANPNLAGKVLAACIDDNGHKALYEIGGYTVPVKVWDDLGLASLSRIERGRKLIDKIGWRGAFPYLRGFGLGIFNKLPDGTRIIGTGPTAASRYVFPTALSRIGKSALFGSLRD